jgi:hypothetical protein
MVLEDIPMTTLNLLVILIGCSDDDSEEELQNNDDAESSLNSVIVVSTLVTAINFGYKCRRVLDLERIRRETKAAEFEISHIKKKVIAMKEVWKGGGVEEELKRVKEEHAVEIAALRRSLKRAEEGEGEGEEESRGPAATTPH